MSTKIYFQYYHFIMYFLISLIVSPAKCRSTWQWRHNGHDGVWIYQPHDCLLNHLLRRRSEKTPKLRFTGLCAGNSPLTSEFRAQMASNAENVYIWWCHRDLTFSSRHVLSHSKGRLSRYFLQPNTFVYIRSAWLRWMLRDYARYITFQVQSKA